MRTGLTLIWAALAAILFLPAGTGAATSAGHVRVAIDSDPDFSNLAWTAKRHGYVILQGSRTTELAKLKAAYPGVRVLLYKNLSASISQPFTNGYYSTGVSYQEADSQHPEWFLRNTDGNRFTFRSWSYLWAMDVGSSSYQRRWADNVIAQLQAQGWDGVFIDDVNPTMKYHYSVSRVAKYPTDEAWQAATESAIANIGPRIRSRGWIAIGNISGTGEYDVGQQWVDYLSGAMVEHFAKWGYTAGDGYAGEYTWQRQLGFLRSAQQRGKTILAVTTSKNGDRAAARYGWASVLLGAEGSAHFALHGDYSNANWFPDYDYKLGRPTTGLRQSTNGIRRRSFENGIVVVNPTSRQRTAKLDGRFSGSGWSNVSEVTLRAKRAAILLRDMITGISRDTSRGTATLVAKTPAAGRASLLATPTVKGTLPKIVVGASSVRLPVRPGDEVRKRLNRAARSTGTGRVRVRAKLQFVDADGARRTETRGLALVKRR